MVSSDDSDREVTLSDGTCVYLIGPPARDLRPINGTDLENDCSDYVAKKHRSGSESKSYLSPYLLYSCLVANTSSKQLRL